MAQRRVKLSQEQYQRQLEAVTGVGPVLAEEIVQDYPTVEDLRRALALHYPTLPGVPGLGSHVVEQIERAFGKADLRVSVHSLLGQPIAVNYTDTRGRPAQFTVPLSPVTVPEEHQPVLRSHHWGDLVSRGYIGVEEAEDEEDVEESEDGEGVEG